MIYHGNLSKMKVDHDDPVQYTLNLEEKNVVMNDLIGNRVSIRFTGVIHCVACGKVTKKAFGQGFCYSCFMSSPLNSECIIRPELCEAHIGKGRDPEWEEEHHNQPHIVYLALTSGVKVGVTRVDQVPVRWIDQGAWKAVQLARTPYRQIAGNIEVSLKNFLTDKTPWQKMLKNEVDASVDLGEVKGLIIKKMDPSFGEYILHEKNDIFEFNYPVLQYPDKVKSLSPEKNPSIDAILTGIRGQYLMFNYSDVLNIRSNSGYEIELNVN